MRKNLISGLLLIFLMASCHRDNYVPKPRAFLRLEYPPHRYEKISADFPFTFEKSVFSRLEIKSDTTFNLYYPGMKARIYMTYAPIRHNLKKLMIDAEKLTYKHAIKANDFITRDFINKSARVYARLNLVTGNAASPLQFYLHDSLHHFVTGSLYFRAVPNYDSIRPPLEYLKKDVKHMLETWQWK